MHHFIRKAFALSAVCAPLAMAAPAPNIPKEDQDIIELLDGYCLANEENFSQIEAMIRAEPKAVPLPQKALQATNPTATETGKGWGLLHNGTRFMVAYMDHGGCSLAGEQVDPDHLTQSLTASYRLIPMGTFEEGPQRQSWYRFAKDSLHAGGVLQVSISKFAQNKKRLWTVNFIPARLAQKVLSP